jgi:integrase
MLTDQYVKEIPWEDNPTFAFNDTAEKYAEAFQNVLQYIPGDDARICFDDDYWDFRPYYEDINSDSYLIRFSNADDDYVNYLKFFVLYAIGRKSKISTAERRISDFICIISSIKANTNHKSFSLITTEDVIDIIESKDISNSRLHSLFACTYLIYDFIQKNYRLDLPIEVDVLKEKSAHYKKMAKEMDDRLPNIPEDYYSAIIDTAIKVLYDNSQPLNLRMTAGLIIIASQTGLRRQDLIGIKTDDLMEKYLPVSGVKCHYLHYQTRKPSKAHSDMLEFDIYASELCAEAFNTMLEIRKDCEFANQPYLYVLPSFYGSTNEYPIAESRYNNEYLRFYYTYLFELTQKDWEGISPVKYTVGNRTSDNYHEHRLNAPKTSQFRVHLATSLYNNGVSLVYIQRYLGHLSEYMIGYYVRPKDDSRENAEFAERIVRKITVDKQTPIGHMGKELKDNLMKFIETGHYNVATDTKQILDDLGEKLVIREKGAGLCCIKTSIIPCKNDARTNEVLCAYGMCPNIFHFYDAIDVTYMQFHAIQDAYQENIDNGFERAAQKELNKIKDFIRRRLTPEINELEKVINKIGIEEFCAQHPDLSSIAKTIPQIKEEIRQWENY